MPPSLSCRRKFINSSMPDSRNGRRFKYNGTDIARDIIQRPAEGSLSVTGEQVHICVYPSRGGWAVIPRTWYGQTGVVTPRANRKLYVTVYSAHPKADITVFRGERLAGRPFKKHFHGSSTLNRDSSLSLSFFL